MLEALPIAAVIVERENGRLRLSSHNRLFEETMNASTVGSVAGAARHCLEGEGRIATHLRHWFEAQDRCGDFDFYDGKGLAARFFCMKLAPLPSGGKVQRALLSVIERTAEVQAERTLRAEMLRDSLTGLPNRLAFTEMIEEAGRSGAAPDPSHAVLVVDMLRFSRINESMGSLAGDELLITFARRLISALRAGDRLARTGGNEFGILVSLGRGLGDALKAAARIQDAMSTPFRLSELEIKVECAIGVSVMQADQDSEALFRHAQFAVKQAKTSGKPEIYEPGEANLARRRFSIETELRRALQRDQLTLFYQPLINLQSGAVAGFEALARWTHEDRGEISPAEFIPVAEESGLILSLGRWAMEKAASTLVGWDREVGESLPFYVGVNLSAIQVARDDIAAMVHGTLRSTGLPGNRLTLELTESAIVQDPRRATRVFDALKALDTTVAMDDFGTGYSSLAYLQRLPIDVLKIDQSFVTGMMEDADSIAIVRAILSLAEALGMSTTAEGIECRELAMTLATLGCASGQGYHFSRPLPAHEALAFWQARQGRGRSKAA